MQEEGRALIQIKPAPRQTRQRQLARADCRRKVRPALFDPTHPRTHGSRGAWFPRP